MDRIFKITTMCSNCSKPIRDRTEIWGKGFKEGYTKEDLMPEYCKECEEKLSTSK